jgi:hypothetical protein
MPEIVALFAECNEIINVETFARVFVNGDDVMHFRSRSCSAMSIAVFTEWISNSIVFAKFTPSVIISTGCCVVTGRASLTVVGMTSRAKLVHI